MRVSKYLIFLLLAAVPLAWAQRPGERGRGPAKVDSLDANEAAEVIDTFRNQRLPGDYIFIFDLEHLPPRSEAIYYRGIMWGTWNRQGPISRISIWPRGMRGGEKNRQLIVQGGPSPRIWELRDGDVVELDAGAQTEPFFSGIVYTPYDILMPFIYWKDYEYIGSKPTLKGRPSHGFTFNAPGEVAQLVPELDSVEMWVDADFYSPVKAIMRNAEGEETRTMQGASFKEIRDQWIIKEIELIDESVYPRPMTIFRVTNAALDQRLDPRIFSPANLANGEPDIGRVMFDPVH